MLATAARVDLWVVGLAAQDLSIVQLYDLCSEDERRKSGAFHFERNRRDFIAGRGLLRCVLGWYLGSAPQDLVFKYGAFGKPTLEDHPHSLSVEFNVAHCEGWVVYAICRDREVGVDIEQIRQISTSVGFPTTFLAKEERDDIESLGPDASRDAFFNCWTRKEAYLKATGRGLSESLDSFRVSVGADYSVLLSASESVRISDWKILHVSPVEGYIGAIAIRAEQCTVFNRIHPCVEDCLHYLKDSPP